MFITPVLLEDGNYTHEFRFSLSVHPTRVEKQATLSLESYRMLKAGETKSIKSYSKNSPPSLNTIELKTIKSSGMWSAAALAAQKNTMNALVVS